MTVIGIEPVERKCHQCYRVVHLNVEDCLPRMDQYMGRHYQYKCPCGEMCTASWDGTPAQSIPGDWHKYLKTKYPL